MCTKKSKITGIEKPRGIVQKAGTKNVVLVGRMLCFGSKKSQIQMFESVAILVVFFFFIAFGTTIWYGAQKASFAQDLERTLESNALAIALRASHAPELDCSLLGVQRQECIDITKAAQFANITLQEQARLSYFELFGFSTIVLHQLYPENLSVLLYNNQLSNATDIHATFLPILVEDPNKNTFSFGMLEVHTYAMP